MIQAAIRAGDLCDVDHRLVSRIRCHRYGANPFAMRPVTTGGVVPNADGGSRQATAADPIPFEGGGACRKE